MIMQRSTKNSSVMFELEYLSNGCHAIINILVFYFTS